MIKNPPPWPNGARCAVAFTFDMDADSILHLEHPDDSIARISATSMLRYGPDIAVPRICDTYAEYGIHQTFFVPAWCIERYPAAVEVMLEGGHEIAHHGYIHENPNGLSREEEAYWLKRSIDVIVAASGERPRGWRAPLYNFSNHSADLLVQEGFTYDASLMGDDVPYLLRTPKGEVIELPGHWGMDDWPPFVHSMDLDYEMQIRGPEEGLSGFRQEFDAMWEHGGLWISVWHPFTTGRLARWMAVERLLLKHMADKGDVWFARLDEIAAHIRACIDDGSWTPRVVDLPYYDEPVCPITRAAE